MAGEHILVVEDEKKIAIEFGKWLAENEYEGDTRLKEDVLGFSLSDLFGKTTIENFKTVEELFEEFLKYKQNEVKDRK